MMVLAALSRHEPQFSKPGADAKDILLVLLALLALVSLAVLRLERLVVDLEEVVRLLRMVASDVDEGRGGDVVRLAFAHEAVVLEEILQLAGVGFALDLRYEISWEMGVGRKVGG
jgi:hypothetical protein